MGLEAMGFDKDYPRRKDWRKPYRDGKAADATCRNHGSCPYCRENRLHKHQRRQPAPDRQTA